MRRTALGLAFPVALAASAGFLWHLGAGSAPPEVIAASRVERAPSVPTLDLRELFEPGAKLRPSQRAASLNGKRVRLVGFMVDMELPPGGALYLASHPVKCDEAGGGTADLPPDAVLVLVPSAAGRSLQHVRGALEAIGRFEIGNQADNEGRVSNFRLHLEGAVEARRALKNDTGGA